MKKRNPMARDLRTPKYKPRVVLSKKHKLKKLSKKDLKDAISSSTSDDPFRGS